MKTNYYKTVKIIGFICIFLWCVGIIYPQQASDFFPDQTDFRWEYKVTPLDSSNNEIDELHYFRHELFMDETDFEGKLTKIIQFKSGPAQTIQIQPYLDSLFYNFSGSEGYEYFKAGSATNLFILLDSFFINSSFNIASFFNSLEQWYPVYRFSQNVNADYLIFQIDSTVTIGNQTLPLRLEFIGERLPDEQITTEFGDLNCKKFVRKLVLSYLIILPPLPPIALPILTLNDYVWIAQDYWIVKSIIPSANVDLSIIGVDPFYIPGLSTKLDGVTGLENRISIPYKYLLTQNYPNPFNPSTKITYTIPERGNVSLKIFDLLGSEVVELVKGEIEAGSYEINFNAANLPSGVYFYRLQAGNFVQTRKMILLK
jgi:hypothetical protein